MHRIAGESSSFADNPAIITTREVSHGSTSRSAGKVALITGAGRKAGLGQAIVDTAGAATGRP